MPLRKIRPDVLRANTGRMTRLAGEWKTRPVIGVSLRKHAARPVHGWCRSRLSAGLRIVGNTGFRQIDGDGVKSWAVATILLRFRTADFKQFNKAYRFCRRRIQPSLEGVRFSKGVVPRKGASITGSLTDHCFGCRPCNSLTAVLTLSACSARGRPIHLPKTALLFPLSADPLHASPGLTRRTADEKKAEAATGEWSARTPESAAS